MKASKLAALALAAMLFPALAFAQQDASATKPTQQSINIEQFDQEMAKAQENLKNMQEQMSLIQKTTDPAQRQKLMQQHEAMMQHGMQMMSGMWGDGMMGCCGGSKMGRHMMGGDHMMGNGHMMGWGQMGSHYSQMTPEQMKQHQYMMDRYMGMQQMMMDQMMQHQQHMGTPIH
ncbi:hypothetical protein [Pseudomonas putida]|jgi:soluble cytochrome b562|uniref:Uncharacterized protein n=1 Tax=Pseudomonas putida TaxID=303 RepID=A0A1L5PVU8_PSEPU|nr:hypothetical protein [Pseudomonas putida]APO84297.1 hypothetical protein BL240_23765 [Pseudomonas putida]